MLVGPVRSSSIRPMLDMLVGMERGLGMMWMHPTLDISIGTEHGSRPILILVAPDLPVEAN